MKRRNLLLGGAGIAAGGALATHAGGPEAAPPRVAGRLSRAADLPRAKGPRLIIVGGGWSGLTIAKYAKRYNRAFDVVLIDRRDEFVSFPGSSSWLADQVNLDFLTHSYVDAARNHGYIFWPATVLDVDRNARRVFTEQGYLAYDYLVLAPGIDYDYARIGVGDPEQEFMLRQNFPGGFAQVSELLTLKRKLHTFQSGTFVLTVPNGDYRCTAAPYERACMAAAVFRKRRIKAKVLLLDMNTGIKIEKDGFSQAFNELYGDYIEYESSAEISAIDAAARTVDTDFDSYSFDDASIYPPIRASRLLEYIGVHNPHNVQKQALTDPLKYHLPGDELVYVAGDSRSQPFSKGGHTAHSEGRYVAEVIAAHAKGEQVDFRAPQTMCFSSIRIDPLEAMSIITFYRYDASSQSFAFDRSHAIEKWSPEGGQASLAWAEGMFRDLFGAV